MSLDPMLLEIIVCPEDKGPLDHIESEGVLLNRRLRRTYAVRDGIPVLLIEEATTIDEDELARLVAIADA
ncbi:MAG: Trm112 family protein [Ilumatobacteraceae bacterium]